MESSTAGWRQIASRADGADLTGADLSGAQLDDDFDRETVIYDETTVWPFDSVPAWRQ